MVHASAGIIDQGLGGLSTDWFSFYYNTNVMNQVATLDNQHWISELGPDHGLGTFPLQGSGANLGFYPPITTNADYGFQKFRAISESESGWRFDDQSLPVSAGLCTRDVSVQRQIGRSWVATADYTGIRGIHLLMPVWGWSLNNLPLDYYPLGAAYAAANNGDNIFSAVSVPNPFFGQSQTFASEPTVPLGQLMGLSPQYTNVTPGQTTWGRSLSNFLNLQIQSRGYHGLTLLASYSIERL